MRLEFRFQQPLNRIYPFIADFQKFSSQHPYMARTVKTPDGYHVYETVPMFGFLKVNEQYHVQVEELLPKKTVRYRSSVKKNISLEILFEFSEREGETVVFETISIQSNALVRWLMEGLMKRAHQQLFAKLSGKSI